MTLTQLPPWSCAPPPPHPSFCFLSTVLRKSVLCWLSVKCFSRASHCSGTDCSLPPHRQLRPLAQPVGDAWGHGGGGGSFHRAGGATGLRGGRMMVPALLEYTRGGEQASKLEVNRQREVKSYLGRGHAGCRGAPHGDAPGAAGCLHLELRRETGRGTEGEGERCWWTSHGSRCRMRRALPGRRGPAETVPVRTPDTSFPFCVVFHGAFQP